MAQRCSYVIYSSIAVNGSRHVIYTSIAVNGSRHVIYTSIAVNGSRRRRRRRRHGLRFENPENLETPQGTCFVLFTDTISDHLQPHGWEVIRHLRTDTTEHFSTRAFSKLPKLLPTYLFADTPTFFKDTKMTLSRESPVAIFSLLEASDERQFIGWAHPCTIQHDSSPAPCDAHKWIIQEADAVVRAGRVANAHALQAQAREYAKTLRSDDVYIDSALLVQRGAWRLFTEWSREMFKDPATDRDQLPFAHVFPLAMQHAEALIIPYDAPSCKAMGAGVCHWWHTTGTGVRLQRSSCVGFEDQIFDG